MTVDKQEALRRGADALGDLVVELRAELDAYKATGLTPGDVKDLQGLCKEKSEAIAKWNRRTQPEIICPLLSDAEVKQPCIEGPCPAYQPENEPTTNADRIRGMSDEELQKFLHEFESGDSDYAKTFCDLCCKDAALERRSVDCEGCLLWWLKNDAKQPQGLDCWTKQPAETEGEE